LNIGLERVKIEKNPFDCREEATISRVDWARRCSLQAGRLGVEINRVVGRDPLKGSGLSYVENRLRSEVVSIKILV